MAHQHIGGERVIPSREGNKEGNKPVLPFFFLENKSISRLVLPAVFDRETRAVNRALRKAYGIGLCSVEELGWAPRSSASGSSELRKASTNGNSGHQNGQPRLRDRLFLLIRQHHLDAGLVKAYAADSCGTPTLRDASRDQVEAFINDLAERVAKDRDGLICQLNSYSKSEEVAP